MNKRSLHIESLATENGFATVSGYHRCSSIPRPPVDADHTGHVWIEILCGMVVSRVNVTPDEARKLAEMLLAGADSFSE